MPLSKTILELAALFRVVARDELLPRHGRLRGDQMHLHSDGSPFTEADLAAEARLIDGARLIYPCAILSGEELISENPGDFLRTARRSTALIFDPIDGTGAFQRGEDTYGMMAAIVHHGVTKGAVIYTPGHAVTDQNGAWCPERDIMILAEKGEGCYVNGRRVMTLGGRAQSLRDGARIAFACRNQDKAFEAVLSEGVPGYQPRNNASHDYTRILTGDMDATFYSEGFIPRTNLGKCPPWDHAAGVLAVSEAGGHAALPYGPDGQAYDPLVCHDRLLVCANAALFQDALRHVRDRTPHLTAPRAMF